MSTGTRFTAVARLLHWTMFAMILAMLFIGVGMVSTVSGYPRWSASIARWASRSWCWRRSAWSIAPDPFGAAAAAAMPGWQRVAAHLSHVALYALMLGLPLVGWAMLSAGAYPVVLYQELHLPAILPPDPMLYAVLRRVHRLLAYLLFGVFLAHLGAALLHALVYRDGVFASMASMAAPISGRLTYPASQPTFRATFAPPPGRRIDALP